MRAWLLVSLLLLAGCAGASCEGPPGPRCEVHGVPLHLQRVEVVYGLVDHEDRLGPRRLFPHLPVALGGCGVHEDSPKHREVRVCDEWVSWHTTVLPRKAPCSLGTACTSRAWRRRFDACPLERNPEPVAGREEERRDERSLDRTLNGAEDR